MPPWYVDLPNVKVWVVDEMPIFGGWGDDIAVIVLPNMEGKLDFKDMLYSEDENFRFWLSQIFEYFKGKGKPYKGKK